MPRYETVVVIESEAATNGEAQEIVRAAIGNDPRLTSVTFVNTVEQRAPLAAPQGLVQEVFSSAVRLVT